MRRAPLRLTVISVLVCLCSATHGAERSADQLVPATTRGLFTIPNVQGMQQSFDRIMLGKLVADPAIKPFIDDLQSQVQSRIDRMGIRVGLTMADLIEVCSGEVAIAFIEPKDRNQKHAVAAIADVTGKEEDVDKLMKRVRQTMKNRKATRETKMVDGVELEIFTVPVKKRTRKTFRAVVFRAKNRLIAVDHEAIAIQILKTLKGDAKTPVLADQPHYLSTMERIEKESGNDRPHMKWFVEPIPYAKVTRAASSFKKRRSNDMLEAIANQGFDALQGVGGFLYFDQGDFEILHYGYVFAPPIAGEPDRYRLAARLLAFPGSTELVVPDWIPMGISSYISATWDIRESYNYIDTLVDEIAGEPGLFDDLIESLETDQAGPRINLEREIVAHLGERVTLITDCETPITADSERFLIAISLSNPAEMEKGIAKLLDDDPDARPIEIDGHQFWEIINEDVEAAVSTVDAADGFAAFGGFEVEQADDEDEGEMALMSNSAISLVDGKLMISSHVDYIVEIMRRDPAEPNLSECPDYQAVEKALLNMGAGPNDIARVFTRADEEFQATYELVRDGKMPESKGLMGQVLNRMLGPKEKGVVREQKIDGKEMPEYQVVRRYLGPVGMFVRTEDDGWFGVAVGLSKETPLDPNLDGNLTTAGRDVSDGETK